MPPSFSCIVCQASHVGFKQLKSYGKAPTLMRCCRCGLVFVYPQPENIPARYCQDDFSPFAYYFHCSRADRRTFNDILRQLPANFNPLRVLDVGCATGTFLMLARDYGFTGMGVEINPASVEWCRAQGLNVFQGAVDNLPNDIGNFDLIYLGDVIEHLPNPKATLSLLRNHLSTGGLIVISTPNFASPATQYFQIKPQEHLFYFTARSLAYMLERSGFRPITIFPFDRWRDIGSLIFSSTFHSGSLWKPLLNTFYKIAAGRPLLVRFPFRENLLAIAEIK